MKKIKTTTDSIIIITSVFPVGFKSTAGMFVQKIAKFLDASHNVQIYLTANQFSYFKYAQMKKGNGLHTHFSLTLLPYISLGSPRYFKAVPQLLSAFFFALFVMSPDSKTTYYGKFKFGAVLAVLFAKSRGGRSFGDFGESDFTRSARYYPKFLLRYVLKNIDSAICLNEHIYNEISVIRGNSNGIYLLHNATDLKLFTPLVGPKNQSKKLSCLFVGHFIHRKGVEEASSAILLADKVGIFIGSGPLKPGGSHILKADTVDHYELPSYYQNADIFVFPSYNEGSPNALIEAISSGLPVVGWDLPFMREHTDASFAILVAPGDVEGLSKAIRYICDDPSLHCMMKISARNYACDNFSLTDRNGKILQIINGVEEP